MERIVVLLLVVAVLLAVVLVPGALADNPVCGVNVLGHKVC